MSLRARLLAGMALVAFVLVATAIVIARTTEAHLIDQVDEQLTSASGPGRFQPGSGDPLDPSNPGGNTPFPPQGDLEESRLSSIYLGQVTEDGTVTTLLVPNLTDPDPPLPQITWSAAQEGAQTGRPFTVDGVGSGLRYRVAARPISGSTSTAFVTALPLGDVDDAVRRLIVVEVVSTLVALLVLGIVIWWVIRLGVQPIKRMTRTATAIAAGDLSHRVPVESGGTEAADLGIALNAMLARIEDAFDERTASEDRLRQFIADASHELRTPVSTVRGYAELYRAGGLPAGDDLDDAMRRTEQEAIRMGNLVDDLLQLARLDQGRPLAQVPVPLDAVADDAARDARAVDPNRCITVDLEPITVEGDEERLRQILGNLVTNALVHTPPGTPVAIGLRRDGDEAVLEVRDQGPGMSAETASRAFERFYRADPSRSRHHGGSGLGLAIVGAIVAAHGGVATIDSIEGRGTTVRIILPLPAR
jgi:two-component system, OmpR family, sensor kinase